jgi:hypothetical protein
MRARLAPHPKEGTMPTYTPVIDNGGEHYNVKAYGAVGDSSTDDSPAFGSAMATTRKTGQYGTAAGEGQPVLVPSGRYRLNTPLNMTQTQMTLRGSGPHQSVLRGNTGGYSYGVLVDMTGATFSSLRDLDIDTTNALGLLDLPNPTVTGILLARNLSQGADAFGNHISNVEMRLQHSESANGYNGTFGIINVGSETTTCDSVYVLADVALYIGSGNNLSRDNDPNHVYRAVSSFIGPILENTSMTVFSVRGCSNLVGISGPAVRIRGGADIDLGDSALLSQASLSGLTAYPYAIEVLAQTQNLRYSGSMEDFKSLLRIDAIVRGLMLDCYAAHDPNYSRIVMEPGALLEGGRINVVPNAGSSGGKLIQAQPGNGVTVRGLDIDLYDQGIDLTSAGTLQSCVIRSTRSLAATKAGIVAGARAGNVILATDGVHVDGITTW